MDTLRAQWPDMAADLQGCDLLCSQATFTFGFPLSVSPRPPVTMPPTWLRGWTRATERPCDGLPGAGVGVGVEGGIADSMRSRFMLCGEGRWSHTGQLRGVAVVEV
jgi:hypothetical protein